MQAKFDRNCLKQENVTFTHKQVESIYIAYDINLWPFHVVQDFTSRNSLLRTVKLTKNSDPDKYKYSGYRIGFDVGGRFSLSDSSGFCKNAIKFDADMSLYVHTKNKKKYILILVQVQHKD